MDEIDGLSSSEIRNYVKTHEDLPESLKKAFLNTADFLDQFYNDEAEIDSYENIPWQVVKYVGLNSSELSAIIVFNSSSIIKMVCSDEEEWRLFAKAVLNNSQPIEMEDK